ncbi:hypothetical protein [Burkholderia mayonis]|uniref:hypothetical protein n=1 Tax=Burkholderia mayonis TaxID=1385591 RepID=UPI000B18B936|nr:hypothetical protein [Burkholderia mayonis]
MTELRAVFGQSPLGIAEVVSDSAAVGSDVDYVSWDVAPEGCRARGEGRRASGEPDEAGWKRAMCAIRIDVNRDRRIHALNIYLRNSADIEGSQYR